MSSLLSLQLTNRVIILEFPHLLSPSVPHAFNTLKLNSSCFPCVIKFKQPVKQKFHIVLSILIIILFLTSTGGTKIAFLTVQTIW